MNGTGHIVSAGMKHNEREWGMRITLDKLECLVNDTQQLNIERIRITRKEIKW